MMTISQVTRESVKALLAKAREYVDELKKIQAVSDPESARTWADVTENVISYADELEAGYRRDNLEGILKGANALSTVNKGVADLIVYDVEEKLKVNAFIIYKLSRTVINNVEKESGMLSDTL